jgi:hypothetical protein
MYPVMPSGYLRASGGIQRWLRLTDDVGMSGQHDEGSLDHAWNHRPPLRRRRLLPELVGERDPMGGHWKGVIVVVLGIVVLTTASVGWGLLIIALGLAFMGLIESITWRRS